MGRNRSTDDLTGSATQRPDRQRANRNADVAWGLREIRQRAAPAKLYGGYYAGAHRLMIDRARLQTIFGKLFAEFRLNLCGAVVNALSDRLQVSGFGSSEEMEGPDATLAGEVWRANRMRRQQIEVHRASIACGDAYVIVWPDAVGNPRIYPQASYEVGVEYDASDPSKMTRAAKLWPTTDPASDPLKPKRLWRLNIFREDRIEKWAASGPAVNDSRADERIGAPPNAAAFRPYPDEDGVWPLLNSYGRVPVFHFANGASALGAQGVSELRDAVPIQDWTNYSVFTMLVGQEFQGFPQRYAIGVEVPLDENGNRVNPFRAGPDRMWFADPSTEEDLEGNERMANVSMGQFAAANLDQLLNVKREAALSLAQATGTPPHHFMLPSQLVSGESQKTAESRLDTKVGDRQANFGDVWGEAMQFALRILRQAETEATFFSRGLDTNWLELKPRNQVEEWQVADMKSRRGVSDAQILREQGYTEEQITSMQAEKDEETERKLRAQQAAMPPAFVAPEPDERE